MDTSIPFIDIAALFGPPSRTRERTDQSIMDGASRTGFMVVSGLPAGVPLRSPTRR